MEKWSTVTLSEVNREIQEKQERFIWYYFESITVPYDSAVVGHNLRFFLLQTKRFGKDHVLKQKSYHKPSLSIYSYIRSQTGFLTLAVWFFCESSIHINIF